MYDFTFGRCFIDINVSLAVETYILFRKYPLFQLQQFPDMFV